MLCVVLCNCIVEGALPFGDETGDQRLSPTDNGCSEKVDLGCNLLPALGRVISSFYVSSTL